jgi:hypothetical protein
MVNLLINVDEDVVVVDIGLDRSGRTAPLIDLTFQRMMHKRKEPMGD